MESVNLGVTLELEGTLTIAQTRALQELISNALHENDHIVVDCSNATEADLTILQLLISAKHTAQALNKSLSLIVPEAGVLSATICRAGISPSELPIAPDPAV